MSDSPLFKARQAAIAKRATQSGISKVVEIVELKEVQEETKKAKKKPEPEAVEPEPVVEPEPIKEVFPPVLENKAIQPEEVKSETKEDEEML
jgi:hypothetical protein